MKINKDENGNYNINCSKDEFEDLELLISSGFDHTVTCEEERKQFGKYVLMFRDELEKD